MILPTGMDLDVVAVDHLQLCPNTVPQSTVTCMALGHVK